MERTGTTWHLTTLCVFALSMFAVACNAFDSTGRPPTVDGGNVFTDAQARDDAAVAHDAAADATSPIDAGPLSCATIDGSADHDTGVDDFERMDWSDACRTRCMEIAVSYEQARCEERCVRELEFADEACAVFFVAAIERFVCPPASECLAGMPPRTRPLWAISVCAESWERTVRAACATGGRQATGVATLRERAWPKPFNFTLISHPERVALIGTGHVAYWIDDDLQPRAIEALRDKLTYDLAPSATGTWALVIEWNVPRLEQIDDDASVARGTTIEGLPQVIHVPSLSDVPPQLLSGSPRTSILVWSDEGTFVDTTASALAAHRTSGALGDVSFAGADRWQWLGGDAFRDGADPATRSVVRTSQIVPSPFQAVEQPPLQIPGPSGYEFFRGRMALDADGNIFFLHHRRDQALVESLALSKHASDGTLLWSHVLREGREDENNVSLQAPLVADNGVVMVTLSTFIDVEVIAFNADGTERWRHMEQGTAGVGGLAIDQRRALLSFAEADYVRSDQLLHRGEIRLVELAL